MSQVEDISLKAVNTTESDLYLLNRLDAVPREKPFPPVPSHIVPCVLHSSPHLNLLSTLIRNGKRKGLFVALIPHRKRKDLAEFTRILPAEQKTWRIVADDREHFLDFLLPPPCSFNESAFHCEWFVIICNSRFRPYRNHSSPTVSSHRCRLFWRRRMCIGRCVCRCVNLSARIEEMVLGFRVLLCRVIQSLVRTWIVLFKCRASPYREMAQRLFITSAIMSCGPSTETYPSSTRNRRQ